MVPPLHVLLRALPLRFRYVPLAVRHELEVLLHVQQVVP
jgi:hypothetical protein